MHIHRPRPLDSVRKFLTEIGVIVVGIAIALGGEQTMEWWHWQKVADESRQALNQELAYDTGVVQNRITEGPCIKRRLAELTTVFRLQAKGQAIAVKRPFGQPQFPHIESSVWETVVASGAAAHMALEQRLRYSRFYSGLFWFRDKTDEESEAWSHLALFEDLDVLTEQDWSTLHQWKAREQAVAAKLDANLEPFERDGTNVHPSLSQAAELGVTPLPFHFRAGSFAARAAFCRAML
jgi:hypothetical protein